MKKRMKQRIALFLSFAMAFTSVDSSILVAAADTTEFISEEVHDHDHEEELAELSYDEIQSESAVVEEAAEEDIVDASIDEDNVVEDSLDEDITMDFSEEEEEQILGDTDVEMLSEEVMPEMTGEMAELEEAASPDKVITGITMGSSGVTTYFPELNNYVGLGSTLTVAYADGTSERYDVYDANINDCYSNKLSFYIRSIEDGNVRYAINDPEIVEGTYKLECEVNGTVFTSEVVYTVVDLEYADSYMPELEPGMVTIHSDPYARYWHRFTAPEDGKYYIEECNNMSVYRKTETGTEYVPVYGHTFTAQKGQTYYLGFTGLLVADEFSWETNFSPVTKEVESISVTEFGRTQYIVDFSEYVGCGTTYTITYKDGTTENAEITNGEDYYTSKQGVSIGYSLKKEGDASYHSRWNPEAGNYALKFEVDGQEVAVTDYVFVVDQAENLSLPELSVGENQIVSAKTGPENWYRFTAPETGKYKFSRVNGMSIRHQTSDGMEWIDSSWSGFSLEANEVYYIGFCGPVWDEELGENVFTWTTDLKKVAQIESITDITAGKTSFVSELGDRITRDTVFTINYSDGTSEAGTLHGYNNYWDTKENVIQLVLKRQGDTEETSYTDWENLSEGTYKLEFYVDNKVIANTDYIYTITSLENAELPELTVGSNTIESSTYDDNPNWYRFTAPETGKYKFSRVNGMSIRHQTSDGMEWIDWSWSGFSLEANEVYYIGFSGSVSDEELGENVFTWTTDLQKVVQIESITDITAGKTSFVSELGDRITRGTVFTINYSDGTSEAGTLHGDNNYWDTKENEIQLVLKRHGDTEETSYTDWENLSEGTYKLEFCVDNKVIANTDYIYTITSLENAELPELTVGSNTIESSIDYDNLNWYRFTAPETGKYKFSRVNGMGIRHQTSDGMEWIRSLQSGFEVEANEVYYIGFCGPVWDDELYEDVYKWTAELSMVPQLTAITDINAGKKNFISGLERITSGTTFTIQYSDGTSEAGTLHGDNNYWDTKENEIQLVLKRHGDTEETSYTDWENLSEGTYKLEFCVDNKVIANTDYIYTITSLENAELPELTVGSNTIESSTDYDNPNWYRFTAPETGEYQISRCNGMKIYHSTENGMENVNVSNRNFSVQANEIYYIGFYYAIYDYETEEDLYTWSAELKRIPAVTEIKVTPGTISYYAGIRQNHAEIDTIQFTYDNGTTKDYSYLDDWYDVDGMGHGIEIYLTLKDGENDDKFYNHDELKAGTYVVHFQLSGNSGVEDTYEITVTEEPTPFNGKATAVEAELGKDYKVSLNQETIAGWFRFAPKEDIDVIFTSSGSKDTYAQLFNEEGEELQYNDDGDNDGNFKLKYTLKAGNTYYYKARFYSVGMVGTFTVSFLEALKIQTLEVVEHNLKKVYLENEGLRDLTVIVKAGYSDGSSEIFNRDRADRYGNTVQEEILNDNGDVVSNINSIGSYNYQLRYGEAEDQIVLVGTVHVTSLGNYIKETVTENEEQQIDASETQSMSYQFSVKDAGIYQLNSNVPFKNLKVYDGEQNQVELSRNRRGYTGYAALQAGTYYVVAELSQDITKLTVSVRKTVLPEKVTAVYGGDVLIAGLDELDSSKLATKAEYTDETTAWVYGENSDSYGNWFSYEMQNGSDETWYLGDTLPVGTYTVKPVVFRTGTSMWNDTAAENQILGQVLTEENKKSATVRVEKPDVSAMTAITENQLVNVSGVNGRYFYSFTPEESGTYTFKYENDTYGDVIFCIDKTTELRSRGSSIKADAGQTYVVAATHYNDYQFSIVKEENTGGEEAPTKTVQSFEIQSDCDYVISSYYYMNREHFTIHVTYADGTSGTVELPDYEDGESYPTWDGYGNSFRCKNLPQEVQKEDGSYFNVTILCGELEASLELPLYELEEKALHVTTDAPVQSSGYQYFSFTPQKSGEYIFRVESQIGEVSLYDYGGRTRFSDWYYMDNENEAVHQVSAELTAGTTYYFVVGARRDLAYSVSVLKPEKKVTDLKITEVPDSFEAYEGISYTYPSELKAEVTYEDNTKENVVLDKMTDSGRVLVLERAYWLNTSTYRLVVQFGKYRAMVDIPAKAWDNVIELKNAEASGGSTSDALTKYSFVPSESGKYRLDVSGISEYYFEVFDADAKRCIWSSYGTYAFQANTEYYIAVYNYEEIGTAFTVTPNMDGVLAEHTHTYVEDKKEATCTEAGYTQQKCSGCGEVQSGSYTEIPATGHTFGDWKVTEAATCTKEGTESRTCACGETETRAIVMIAHDWETRVLKEATETEEGESAEFCKVCDTEKPNSRKVIPMTSHQFGDWTVTKEAACTEAGSRERTCIYENCPNCKDGNRYVQTEDIPALGHSMTKTEAVAATCTKAGNNAYWTCERCKKVYADEAGETETTVEGQVIPALGHSMTKTEAVAATCTEAGNNAYWTCERCEKVYADEAGETETTVEGQVNPALGHSMTKTEAVAATCTEKGNNAYWTCERCAKVYADEAGETETTIKDSVIPATGHTFDGWEQTKAATCTEDGTLTRSCKACGTTETATIPATGHSYAEEKKEATCTDSGYTQQKCSVCKEVQDGSYHETAPLGHDYSNWTVTKAATCTEKGEQRKTCSRCGDKDSEEITATGHNYVAEEKAATCTEDGYSQNKCTVCGEVKDGSYEKVEATGHAYGDKVYTKEATCTENGAFTQTCNNCGYVLQGLEEMTGHSFAEDRKEATCTEDGYTQQKCSKCQTVTDYQILPATGHTFGNWKVTEAATCTKEGTESRTCACGETETRTISMIAHDWETRILKEATNTEEGEEAEFCKVCGTEKPDSRRVIPMTSHQMGEWTVIKEATCTEAGSRQRTCTYENCTICTDGERYVQTEVIPALGHDLEGVEWKTEKEATCTEEGIRTKTCNECHNVVETETVEKLPHIYVSDGKAATCTTDGYAQMICENCRTIKEGSFTTVPKTGHIFGVGDITVAPTCTDQGLITFTCEQCKAKRIGVLPVLEHKWKTTVEKEATCSSTGIQDLRCEDCGIVQEDSEETIELKPHTWSSEVTVDNQPTCTENGQQSIHCTKCHAILKSSVTVLPATGHDYAEKAVPATCTSDGSVQKVCKVCGDTQTEILTKTGHTMTLDTEQSTMATCIDDGILVYICQNDGCGKKEYRVQGALDHSFGEEQTKEETDTENGKIYKVCSRCGEEQILSIIPSTAQKSLIDTVKTEAEAKNTNEAIAAISQIDKEILLSDTDENLVSAVEDLLINNGTSDGTKYAQTVIAGDLNGTVTGATITAATVSAQASEPAAVLMSMDARTLEEDVNDSQMMVVSDDLVPLAEGTGDTVQSTLHVKTNTGTNENGKPYLDMTLSMTVGEVPVSELATPITPTFIAPEAFWATEGTIVTADNKEQKVTVESDGTFTFTTAVLGTVRLTVETCTGTHTKPENVTVKQATCTDPATETYTCSKCKTVVTETTAEAEGHDYSVVMTETPATCKASGEQTLKCSKCEATTRKTLPKSNIHSYTWTTKQEVTCTTDGEKEGICSVCNDVCNDKAMITIPATGHKYDETFTEDKPATCKEEGSESRHCKNGCGAKVDTRSIPKLNHVFNTEDPNLEWTLAKSCSEKDSADVTCSNSNCTETKTIYRTAASPTAHSWDEAKTVTEPSTCTAAGSETKICESCGYTHTEELPLKAHTLVKTERTPATCEKSGNKEYWTCKECMHVFADAEGKNATTVSACVIPATGNHTMVEKVDKKATCGTAGSKHSECSVCGKKNPATVIPATGAHTFGSYAVTKKPTVLATGTETRTCSVCGTKEDRTIAKLNGTIKLTAGSLPLQIKKSFALSRIVTGLSEGDSIASFTSDKPNVATVDRSGKVTGKAAGTAVITITLASKTSAKVKVVVQKKTVVTKSIGNISRSWNAKIGEKKQLAPVISPLTTTDKLTYSSSNKKVATVSSKGQIVAKKAGTAKITVKSGKKKVVVNVKVAPTPPTGMTGVAAAKTLKKGKSFTIKPKLTPSGAEAKISFKSSNSKIAAVNSKGKVTAKKAGTAVITVKAGNVVRTCTVTVK